MEWFNSLIEWMNVSESDLWSKAIGVLIVLAVGIPLLNLIALLSAKMTKKRFSIHSSILVRKSIKYSGYIIIIIIILKKFGFELATLLGAAGIAGIAIGFAAQTSVSNVISGIFLISEKPFQVGDLIRVGDTTGVVHAIDLLSIKLRKLDNLFVRIPNESIIKTEVTNITRFPIRRMDINIGVAYKEDIGKVRTVLTDLAKKNIYCLDEPAPLILFKDFGGSALEFLFGLWFYKTDYLALRNSIMQELKERFDAEGIELPFPHRTLYTGSATQPFPIRIMGTSETETPEFSPDSGSPGAER